MRAGSGDEIGRAWECKKRSVKVAPSRAVNSAIHLLYVERMTCAQFFPEFCEHSLKIVSENLIICTKVEVYKLPATSF